MELDLGNLNFSDDEEIVKIDEGINNDHIFTYPELFADKAVLNECIKTEADYFYLKEQYQRSLDKLLELNFATLASYTLNDALEGLQACYEKLDQKEPAKYENTSLNNLLTENKSSSISELIQKLSKS